MARRGRARDISDRGASELQLVTVLRGQTDREVEPLKPDAGYLWGSSRRITKTKPLARPEHGT
jgi:hypothetical protein